ncbi:NADPH-dependent assimilatory sulfite reductase hemoprotein subunit [Alicyclobacillus tolerans]|uniref:NADPH-dependent assimilatory sulfite reductase hemoprotein subunit n=1 Tax=Alicyclobacillus tolerans TaxID=90970 RepID=UPI001F024259|nr:NADPH-dependent assimilatory sulfite reductase hemoprotein subunit [Alicyclobacillus tolerans]MCF8565525.1 NADPH-dependent assimilatory sulfite reductase hemoprotein subunit [Alicyclobacillus tolerans]
MLSNEKLSKVEVIKLEGNQLRGTIAESLNDGTPNFEEENIQQLKFHGVYQQDDRDLRKQLRKEGKERHYMMMIRARIPGGILNADQYLQFDDISERYGNQTMRITTRQTFQLHGVLKGDLKATIKAINDALVTTLGGCGDQVRNTIACAMPRREPYAQTVREDLMGLVDRFAAKTHAYHEIWLDGEKVDLATEDPETPKVSQSSIASGASEEPLYGRAYLPRKFKIGFTYEGDNCADVYSNDLGIVAHVEDGEVAGYTLLIGGGMGRTASDENTYPRLASPFAFVTRAQLAYTCEAIVTVQRDFGNRENRKFARMKYLIDTMGLDWFKKQVEERVGFLLTPPRPLVWQSFEDHLGWHLHGDSSQGFLGLFIANGRIKDEGDYKLKSVLREIVREYRPTIHLTTQQNLILEGIAESDRPAVEKRLREAGLPLVDDLSALRKNAMACPAMPTCGLAIAESERALPTVLPQLEGLLARYGLADEPIAVRMTGCANGCARPYISDIGFVGRVLGKYDVFLGASSLGTRLNERFLEQVPLEELAVVLEPVIARYASDKHPGERLGDFCHRVGLETLREVVSVSR